MDVQAKYKKCMNYLKGNKKYLTIKIENKNNFFFMKYCVLRITILPKK